MDVLRENIGLLLLEGADHTKLLKKIEAKYGLNINPDLYGVPIDKIDHNDEQYKKNRVTARLAMLHAKNLEAAMHKKKPMTAYANEKLQDLRIERFWDKGKVKLSNPSFDVRDRKNSIRNMNLQRAQQAARDAGTTRKTLPDGRIEINTTTYDPIHNKLTHSISYEDGPTKKPITNTLKDNGWKKGNYKLGLGVAAGLGAGLYALRKHYQNKNKSFLRRLFKR